MAGFCPRLLLTLQFTLQLLDLLTILLRLLPLGFRLCGTVGAGLQTRFAPGLEQALDIALKGAVGYSEWYFQDQGRYFYRDIMNYLL